MRGSGRTWLFEGLALALCASALLAGCVAADGHGEEIDEASHGLSALPVADDARAPQDRQEDEGAGSGEEEPETLSPLSYAVPPAADDDGRKTGRTRQGELVEPDPTPWHPTSGSKDPNKNAHSDGDSSH